jgi:acyl dehydratase
VNQSRAGTTYQPVSFSVTAERVRTFAEAVGADGPGVPPTFATAPEIEAMAAVLRDPELDLDFTRVVHAEQSYDWVRPIETGDELTARSTIESIRSKAGSEILVISTDIRDATGAVIVLATCTLVVRPPAAPA